MKLPSFISLAILLALTPIHADSNKPAEDTIWTSSWAEGGDAASSCYYFLGREGGVTRVRILYVATYDKVHRGTDYFVESGEIRVHKISGDTAKTAQQVQGKDDGITVEKSYTLSSGAFRKELASSLGNKDLTEDQRQDLWELLAILKDLVPDKPEKEAVK